MTGRAALCSTEYGWVQQPLQERIQRHARQEHPTAPMRDQAIGHVDLVPMPIASISIRDCPKLPPTTDERIADNRAQTVADSVMYREALATAAEARGWSVHWYDRECVFRDAVAALGRGDIDAFLHAMGRSIGPPWQSKHKLAPAAALAATAYSAPRSSAG